MVGIAGESARVRKWAENERGREQARLRGRQRKFCGLGGVGQHSPSEPGDKVALRGTSGERKKKKRNPEACWCDCSSQRVAQKADGQRNGLGVAAGGQWARAVPWELWAQGKLFSLAWKKGAGQTCLAPAHHGADFTPSLERLTCVSPSRAHSNWIPLS